MPLFNVAWKTEHQRSFGRLMLFFKVRDAGTDREESEARWLTVYGERPELMAAPAAGFQRVEDAFELFKSTTRRAAE